MINGGIIHMSYGENNNLENWKTTRHALNLRHFTSTSEQDIVHFTPVWT